MSQFEKKDRRIHVGKCWEMLNSRCLKDIQGEISRCPEESSELAILDMGETGLRLGFQFKLDQ